MLVEWILRLTDMGSSDSVEVRSLEVHDLRPLFRAIFTDSSLSYGYLYLSIDQSSSHLQFPSGVSLLVASIAGGDEESVTGNQVGIA
nr:hypothetical protein Iba_scaffold259CG0490 [Ipomoea batatas]